MKVFVYGTLLKGEYNSCLLDKQEFIREAWTTPEFTMVNLGGFPGLLEGGHTAIAGEVYEVDEECMFKLDRLEGCYPNDPDQGMYGRINLLLDDGEEVMAYRYNARHNNDLSEIPSGNWKEHSSAKRRHRG